MIEVGWTDWWSRSMCSYYTRNEKGQLSFLTVCVVSFQVDISWSVNDIPQGTIKHPVGFVPIMVKSKLCNLYNLSPQELIQHHEEEEVMRIL